MKILNVILVVCILMVISMIIGTAYAAYTITLTDTETENIQIYRQSVVINESTGETEMQMKMSMNYTLYNADGDTKGKNVEFALSAAQRTQIKNFVKPFVQAQAVTDDVTAPGWAQ